MGIQTLRLEPPYLEEVDACHDPLRAHETRLTTADGEWDLCPGFERIPDPIGGEGQQIEVLIHRNHSWDDDSCSVIEGPGGRFEAAAWRHYPDD
jgi:hypothetical protein